MFHVIRVNVANHGYTLYSVDGGRAKFLGGEAPAAAKDYEALADHLDNFLERHGASSMAFRRSANGPLTFGYACRLDACDQYERRGLTFLHTVVFDDPALLPSCALTALASLSGPGINELTQRVEHLARGALQPAELLPTLARSFEEARRFDPSELQSANSLMGSIVHDCGGAAALAWTTLAMQQIHAASPWEVFDTASAGRTVTRTEPSMGREVRASELLVSRFLQPITLPVPPAPQKPRAPGPSQVTGSPAHSVVAFPRGHEHPQERPAGRTGPGAALAVKDEPVVLAGEEKATARRATKPTIAAQQFLLMAAGLLILISLLWARGSMKELQERTSGLEHERDELREMVTQVKGSLRAQEERVDGMVEKKVSRLLDEYGRRKTSENAKLLTASFLQVPLLGKQPKQGDCTKGHQGRMALYGKGSNIKLYLCGGSNEWLVTSFSAPANSTVGSNRNARREGK